MRIELEIELNRAWIYNDKDEIIGETNFIVPTKWLNDIFEKYYKTEYTDFEDFLEVYEPETEGEFIYKKAKEESVLKEDLGVVMLY